MSLNATLIKFQNSLNSHHETIKYDWIKRLNPDLGRKRTFNPHNLL